MCARRYYLLYIEEIFNMNIQEPVINDIQEPVINPSSFYEKSLLTF